MLGVFALLFSLGFASGYYYLDAQKEGAGVIIEDKSGDCAALFEANADNKNSSAPSSQDTAMADAAGTVLSDSTSATKRFAASKNSTLYHTPDCSYVKRIKEENIVWYGSEAEAGAAGKKPHKCISGGF